MDIINSFDNWALAAYHKLSQKCIYDHPYIYQGAHAFSEIKIRPL